MESLLPLLLIFAVMMLPLLFMSNRQKKMQQKQADLVKQLGVGDEVRTHSGFYGLIIDSYDDVVILESENGAQTKWARQAVSQRVDPVEEFAADLEDSSEEQSTDVEDDRAIPGVTVADEDLLSDDPRRDDR
ncbi:preprotein translocase subunit YajC [Brachybacterium sp. AOP29-B2-41]|uniref:preprotein translocase subunit YajC n=1 Tax=Brachybacterium sp. AOP29-B2-41 TaxID=3457704 RepID=UPI004034ABE2